MTTLQYSEKQQVTLLTCLCISTFSPYDIS